MRRLLMLLCLLALTITPTIAQTDEPESWEIVERCVGEPVEPPDDWSFEGIIFALSDYAVHGLSSAYDTPYVIVFRNSAFLMDSGTYASSGAISPDGRWFAVPVGTSSFNNVTQRDLRLNQIRLYSTDGRRQLVQSYWEFTGIGTHFPAIHWLNDNELVYLWGGSYNDRQRLRRLNPFTGYVEDYEGEPFNLPNPILTIVYYDIYNNDFTLSIAFNPSISQTQLHNVTENSISSIIGERFDHIAWHPSTNQFALVVNHRLFIGSADSKSLTNTCLTVSTVAWSPDSELAASDGERITIINFDDDTHYIAAYHEGSVFDWRVPPEEN